MTILGYPSGGYVGINTITPGYNMDINGNARCSGNLNISNYLNFTTPENNITTVWQVTSVPFPSGT